MPALPGEVNPLFIVEIETKDQEAKEKAAEPKASRKKKEATQKP